MLSELLFGSRDEKEKERAIKTQRHTFVTNQQQQIQSEMNDMTQNKQKRDSSMRT
jgi:hypothetical protein